MMTNKVRRKLIDEAWAAKKRQDLRRLTAWTIALFATAFLLWIIYNAH